MARLRWTDEATRALEDLYAAMARSRPSTARRTIEGIVQRARSLARYPGRGTDTIYPADRPVLVLRHGQFRIAYVVGDDAVTILTVFHGGIFLPP